MALLTGESLHTLKNAKALLAFSAGADSTALFFSLIEHGISFDIAIVHYGLRDQADKELSYAHTLADKYRLQCHALKVKSARQNFEAEARKQRYDFFEKLMDEQGYTHLLTAHHLQDRLEWMLMQLSKGAGAAELLGMHEQEQKAHYTLFRPLLNVSKEEILNYLREHQHHWYHDESNDDLNYKRNYFRHAIVNELLKEHTEGIKQSFKYLQEDVSELIKKVQIHEAEELSLFYATGHKRSDIFHIDKILKTKGHLLSAAQRQELTTKDEIIAGRKFLVVLYQGIYYIAPYLKEPMDKAFKEECRRLGVPAKLRPYLFHSPLAFILYTRFIPCDR